MGLNAALSRAWDESRDRSKVALFSVGWFSSSGAIVQSRLLGHRRDKLPLPVEQQQQLEIDEAFLQQWIDPLLQLCPRSKRPPTGKSLIRWQRAPQRDEIHFSTLIIPATQMALPNMWLSQNRVSSLGGRFRQGNRTSCPVSVYNKTPERGEELLMCAVLKIKCKKDFSSFCLFFPVLCLRQSGMTIWVLLCCFPPPLFFDKMLS